MVAGLDRLKTESSSSTRPTSVGGVLGAESRAGGSKRPCCGEGHTLKERVQETEWLNSWVVDGFVFGDIHGGCPEHRQPRKNKIY